MGSSLKTAERSGSLAARCHYSKPGHHPARSRKALIKRCRVPGAYQALCKQNSFPTHSRLAQCSSEGETEAPGGGAARLEQPLEPAEADLKPCALPRRPRGEPSPPPSLRGVAPEDATCPANRLLAAPEKTRVLLKRPDLTLSFAGTPTHLDGITGIGSRDPPSRGHPPGGCGKHFLPREHCPQLTSISSPRGPGSTCV